MDTEKNRMKDLVKLFEKKDEIFSKNKKEINEENLTKEYNRLKDLSSDSRNADFRESAYPNNGWETGGVQGQTVNNIVSSAYDNPAVTFGAVRQPLKVDEAFEIAVKRTIESGAPVNGMGFYEEVNWNLAQLGFTAKNALDIKTKLVSMISKDKE